MLKLLIIMGLACGLVVGLVSRQKVARTLGTMVVFAFLFPFAWSLVSNLWSSLTTVEQVLAVIAGGCLLILVALTATQFGREVLASMVGDFFYDGLKRIFRRRRH